MGRCAAKRGRAGVYEFDAGLEVVRDWRQSWRMDQAGNIQHSVKHIAHGAQRDRAYTRSIRNEYNRPRWQCDAVTDICVNSISFMDCSLPSLCT